jgi:hypothetical protein
MHIDIVLESVLRIRIGSDPADRIGINYQYEFTTFWTGIAVNKSKKKF